MSNLAEFEAEHTALYEQASKVKPPEELPSTKYWVGILWHSHEKESITEQSQLLWIKAKPTHKAAKLRAVYESSPGSHDVNPVLLFYGRIIHDSVTVENLDRHSSHLIILRAVDPTSNAAATASLNPIFMPYTSAREPLREVSRQVSTGPASTIQVSEGYTPPKSIPTQSPTPFSGSSIPSIIPSRMNSENLPGPYLASSEHLSSYPNPISQAQGNSGFIHKLESPRPVNGVAASTESPSVKPEHQAGIKQEILLHPDENLPAAEEEDMEEDNQQYFNETDQSRNTGDPEVDLCQAKNLQQLMKEGSVETLERGLEKGLIVLDAIKTCMETYEGQLVERDRYLSTLDSITQMATRNRTVVGVVGNTGAGKSSVINAVLEEERLLPTNCMRACTAVVTEVSWNEEKNERKKYRAEVEFIQADDWERELKILFDDMINAEGEVARDGRNTDSEAGIAWAKIKAVYPQITKDMISRIEPEYLLDNYHVKKVLGTTHRLYNSSPLAFYDELQRYVDSPDKKTEEQTRKRQKKEMEYWPLIKVVRIYTKSDALSTGAVIVDLPGVHDSNAARAAVAEGYLRQCTRLWVVAPINRAVDDKAAKKLLGDQFKRQLKYDGTYECVTFICSKTDQINITEASDAIDAKEKINQWWEEIEKLKKEEHELKKKKSALREEKAVRSEIYNDQDQLLDKWEELLEKAQDGHVVFAPKSKIRGEKRKLATKGKKSNKRANMDSQASFVSDLESDAESEAPEDKGGNEEERSEPLTVDDIKARLAECKELKRTARKEKLAIGRQLEEVKQELRKINEKIEDLESDIASECIAGRNQYSKGAIRQDFAAGIKELDQENAIEEDEENFNPDEDLRDYEEVANSLPVYCVSSIAYQKLCGHMKMDAMPGGFKAKEETEIPQLQAHCKQLTEASRISKCQGFLNKVHQLLNSLSIWSSQDGTGLKLTDAQHQAESAWLNKTLRTLEEHFDKAVTEGVEAIKNALTSNLFQHYPATIKAAEAEAIPRAAGWGKPKAEGGLFYQTYKATCRRYGGPFKGSGGEHDFNKQLAEPIEKLLANRWELTFQRRIPTVLKNITTKLNNMLVQFHQAVERRAEERGLAIPGLHFLVQHVEASQGNFRALVTTLSTVIAEKQKEASRQLVPVISAAMTDGYQRCVDERGSGSYMRMKAHMLDHVNQRMGTMFWSATESVKNYLRKMRLEIEEHMKNETELVFQAMRSEYFAIVVGTKLPEGYVIPREERKLKRDIGDLIHEADERFRRVLVGEGDPKQGSPQAPAEQDEANSAGEIPEANGDLEMENGEDAVNSEAHTPERSDVKMKAGESAVKNEQSAKTEGQEDTEMGETSVDNSPTTTSKTENNYKAEQPSSASPGLLSEMDTWTGSYDGWGRGI